MDNANKKLIAKIVRPCSMSSVEGTFIRYCQNDTIYKTFVSNHPYAFNFTICCFVITNIDSVQELLESSSSSSSNIASATKLAVNIDEESYDDYDEDDSADNGSKRAKL